MFRDTFAVELISILTVLTAAYLLFRPLAAPRDLDPALALRLARTLRGHCGAVSV